MKTFNQYFLESKNHLIDGNPLLSYDEKRIVKNYFSKYPQKEKYIDWNFPELNEKIQRKFPDEFQTHLNKRKKYLSDWVPSNTKKLIRNVQFYTGPSTL